MKGLTGTFGIFFVLFITSSVEAGKIRKSESTKQPFSKLHQEARNVTYQKIGCGKQDLCIGRREESLKSPGNLTLERFLLLPCFCDWPECYEFGDCCVDLVSSVWEETKNLSKVRGFAKEAWQCNRFTDLRNHAQQESVLQYAWMVSKCPETESTNELSDQIQLSKQCDANFEELGHEYSYMHDIPVIVDGVLFKNVFCAACFGHSPSQLVSLTLDMHCNGNATGDQISFGRYIPGEATWELGDGLNCSLRVREFLDMTTLNEQLLRDGFPLIRQCRPNIDTCPEDFAEEKLAAKCAAYSLSVIDASTHLGKYKNPHCALCHGKDFIKCHLGSIPRRRSDLPGSFSLIFHFSLGGEVVGQRDCSPGFVWDAIYGRCRPIFSCQEGSRYKASQCPVPGKELGLHVKHLDGTPCDKLVLDYKEFDIRKDGSLFIKRTKELLNASRFTVLENNKTEVCVEDVASELTEIDAEAGSEFPELQGLLTLVCTSISLIGLALHIGVFLSLPRLRNLPGLISMSTSSTLFTAQALFLWSTSANRPRTYTLCVVLAVALHFFFLQVFAWTSIMSYDIWRTFSHPTQQVVGRRSSTRRMRFVKYTTFANLLPMIIVGSSLSLDLSDSTFPISPFYAGSSICWFGNRAGLALFFATPVSILLLCNIIMYGLVIRRVQEQRRATRCLVEFKRRGDSVKTIHCPKSQKYTENDCKLHFSIFNVMGGTWILGIIAGIVDHPILWYVFIVLNGSQGAVIFILQIIKPRVWEMLRNKISGREESSTSKTPTTNTQTHISPSSLIRNSTIDHNSIKSL